ncbi:hypothetical protein ACFC1T_02350 [Kitasatospora sp. NPDC056076]|uniref:hypothetical protein n=1 Tax=Kitasatospora sp. NPDC056076 TaxID=3345703 RepID=UPI0035DC681C
MTPATPINGVVWIKREWKLLKNPFPATGMARVGGNDDRENGQLYEPGVHTEQLREAIDKFVLGMAFSGLKFGYLWSAGTSPNDSDARGFGKSVFLQHLTGLINADFGATAYQDSGLDESDAAEVPICSLFTSFDTTQVKSLGAALFTAVEYAVRFHLNDTKPLARTLRDRLIERVGDDDVKVLTKTVADAHRSLRGRTLGPPNDKLIVALCDEDPQAAVNYLGNITPMSRSRNGAVHFATFLVFAEAAGIKHVLLCCDQLEDLASTTTTKAKRELEVERFRDIVVETLPMADMVALVTTLHPRASLAMKRAWDLADLPSFDLTPANQMSTMEMPPLRNADQVAQLLRLYLAAAAKQGTERESDIYPFTSDAVDRLFELSARKPRDVLRKAHTVLEVASAQNLPRITAPDVESALSLPGQQTTTTRKENPGTIDWSRG